jgi:hypothetical protein
MAYVIQVFVQFLVHVSMLICFLCLFGIDEFYVHVTVHCNKFLYNKTNQMHQFHKFLMMDRGIARNT